MLYMTEQKELDLERLPFNETDTSSPVFINVRNNNRLNSYIINLEQVLDYAEDNLLSFDEAVHKICYQNDLNEDNIAFSVQPSSLYLNEAVRNIVVPLYEENKIFILNNTDSIEAKLLDAVCEECIKTESLDPLDKLIQSVDEGNMFNSYVQGATKGSMQALGHAIGGGINAIATGAKKGFVNGASDTVNRGMGRLLDRNGQRNGAVTGVLNRFGVNTSGTGSDRDREITGMANSVINGIRKEVSDSTVKSALNFAGINPNSTVDVNQMINNLTNKINYFGGQIFNAKGDENKQSMFKRIYDKLVNLKNKIMDKIKRR